MSLLDELQEQRKAAWMTRKAELQYADTHMRAADDLARRLADLDRAISALTPAEDAAVGVVEGEVSALDDGIAPKIMPPWAFEGLPICYRDEVPDGVAIVASANHGQYAQFDNTWYRVVEREYDWGKPVGNEYDATVISTPAEESDPPPADVGVWTQKDLDSNPETSARGEQTSVDQEAPISTGAVPDTPSALPAAAEESRDHSSDCAIFNEPAFAAGPCDCGAAPGSDGERADLINQASDAIDQSLSDVGDVPEYVEEDAGIEPHRGELRDGVLHEDAEVFTSVEDFIGKGIAREMKERPSFGIQSDEAKKHEAQGWRSLWPIRQKADA